MLSTVTVLLVEVKPDPASKKTLSPGPGTQYPPVPPLVCDQCALSFQLPLPPTQYRSCPI